MRAAAAPTPEPENLQQPEEIPAGPAADQPAPANDEDPLYGGDADDAPEDQAGDDGQSDSEDEPAPQGEDGHDAGEDTLSTVDQLLEQTQLDPAAFGKLKINVKVDRETKAVPVSELIKSYQIGEAATKRLEDAKVKAAALTSDAETKREALHASLSSVAKLLKSAEDVLEQDIKAIDWNELRAKDPAEYAAKKDEIRERREKINSLKEEGARAWRDAVASQREQARAAAGETISEQKTKLLEAIPTWSDPEKAKAEVAQLTDFLVKDRGFTSDEVAGTTDYRLLVIAREAWLYRDLQAKANAAKKRVATVPKTLKPNSSGGAAPRAAKEKTLLEDLYG